MLVNDSVGKKPFDNLMVEGPLQEAGKTAMLTNILAGSFVFLLACKLLACAAWLSIRDHLMFME
jgi:hypothetical protein